ncbi:MAG: translation initiation factor IF-2 [Candidatus Omnitrophica bacterium]|nr:translation initiation factor IF-2 [Candidatus Omnitrophota bacterium]
MSAQAKKKATKSAVAKKVKAARPALSRAPKKVEGPRKPAAAAAHPAAAKAAAKRPVKAAAPAAKPVVKAPPPVARPAAPTARPVTPARPAAPPPAPAPAARPAVPPPAPAAKPATPVRPEPVEGKTVRASTSSARTEAPPAAHPVVPPPAPKPAPAAPKPLTVQVPLTVKEMADKLSVSPSELIKKLIGMKVMATINQLLGEETVEKLVKLYGFEYQRMPTLEEQLEAEHEREDTKSMVPRAPVVTFMGHVDHGKTSLLDAIRESRVVEGEAGGITQHIGAYRVTLPKGAITFLDTPGHEAFTAMRARGANVTDIVVLVVAADDGVMPQTIEAIDHARAAEATLVVAMNKIDKPSANPDKVKKQLMEHGLMSEEWGGKTVMASVSAKTGQGIDELLDLILLEAELLELKANPARPARGVVLEGEHSKGGGPIAHVLVQSGTLRVGDMIVSGTTWGRVRALADVRGHRLQEAGPSMPVELLGLAGVPQAGDTFLAVPEERQAREIATRREEERKGTQVVARRVISLEEFHRQLEQGKVKSLNLILKADVQGSVGALRDSLLKLSSEQVDLKILHTGAGDVTEPDILLAEASNAVVIGFNVGMTPEAEVLAKQERVDVKTYRIIYEAVADVKAALEGLLEPRLVEQVIGRAKVLQSFKVSKVGTIAGCQVVKGKITRGAVGRVIRGQEALHQGKISSLKRFKDDAREVTEGIQCGIGISGWSDFQPDDVIEAVEVQQVAQRL